MSAGEERDEPPRRPAAPGAPARAPGKGQTVYDWSGNGNHGTLGSTPGVDANDPTWTQGIFGASRALAFDGDDVVTIPRSSSLEPKRLTASSWLRGSWTPGPYRYVVSKGGQDCLAAASYGLYTGSGGGLAFYVYDGTTFYVSPQAPQTVWDNAWHNAAGTFDGSKVRLYVDGRQVGTGRRSPRGQRSPTRSATATAASATTPTRIVASP